MRNGRLMALCGILAALAAALSWADRALALGLLAPLPGVKLGLANIVSLFALYCLGFLPALSIVLTRCLLGAALGGGVTGLLFSLTGGLFALGVMALLKKTPLFSLYGVSVAGAAAHNLAQMAVCVLLLGSQAPLRYLIVLMPAAAVTGCLTGFLSLLLLNRLGPIPGGR